MNDSITENNEICNSNEMCNSNTTRLLENWILNHKIKFERFT